MSLLSGLLQLAVNCIFARDLENVSVSLAWCSIFNQSLENVSLLSGLLQLAVGCIFKQNLASVASHWYLSLAGLVPRVRRPTRYRHMNHFFLYPHNPAPIQRWVQHPALLLFMCLGSFTTWSISSVRRL